MSEPSDEYRKLILKYLTGRGTKQYGTAGNTAGETKEISIQRTTTDQITIKQGNESDNILIKSIFDSLNSINIRLKKLEDLFIFEEEETLSPLLSRQEIRARVISLLQESDRPLYRYEIANNLNLDLKVVSEIVEELENEDLID